MKNNLISAIAGWKSAALLVLVAMVAAVAFSGVLSISTAQAATVDLDSGDAALDMPAAPGDTVNIVIDGADAAFVQVTIDAGSTASGGFGSSGAQSIACSANTACDVGRTTATPPVPDDSNIKVALKIDADSPEGFILINVSAIGATGAVPEIKVINVSKAGQPGSISVSAAEKSIAAATDVGDNITTVLTARLLNAQADPVGLNTPGANDAVKFDVDGPGTLTCNTEASGQVCSVSAIDFDHDDDEATPVQAGYATATINATGRPGTITVTASFGGLEATTSIVVYGNPTSITAVAQQSSIEIGGSTFIVVTATDAGDNAVSGKEYGLKSPGGNVGPAEKAVPVVVSALTNKEAVAGALSAAPGSTDLPSCDAHLVIEESDAEVTQVVVAQAPSSGTNAAGQCVIKVSATKGATAAASSTRGTHTITVAGPAADGSADVAVDIQVGGAPSEITTDAPARVDALSATTINIAVVDDEGVPVGMVDATVDQIEGDGKVLAPDVTATSDGAAKFTYLAPSRDGTAVFRVTAGSGAGTIAHNVVVSIGAAAEEAPDAPPATWNNALVSGAQNPVWNGDDDADVADGAAEGVTAIWQWNGTGWDGYFPAAADVPGGNTLSTLSNGAAYWVIVD